MFWFQDISKALGSVFLSQRVYCCGQYVRRNISMIDERTYGQMWDYLWLVIKLNSSSSASSLPYMVLQHVSDVTGWMKCSLLSINSQSLLMNMFVLINNQLPWQCMRSMSKFTSDQLLTLMQNHILIFMYIFVTLSLWWQLGKCSIRDGFFHFFTMKKPLICSPEIMHVGSHVGHKELPFKRWII